MRLDRNLTFGALLAVGVLAPTAAVIWFMTEAASSQSEAARQSVNEAWRGQLRLLRNRVDASWKSRAAAIDAPASRGDYPGTLDASGADAVILLRRDGSVAYPQRPAPKPPDTAPRLLAAEALEAEPGRLAEAADVYSRLASSAKGATAEIAAQGHIRCLRRLRNREAMLTAVDRYFAQSTSSIAANAYLLAVDTLPVSDKRRARFAGRLTAMLNDYERTSLPSPQRVFLMSELRARIPDLPAFRTEAAERLALTFLEAQPPRATDHIEAAGLPDVWKLGSPNGLAVVLFRTASINASGASGEDVKFTLSPPGAAASDVAVGTGPMLPGWQLALTSLDTSAIEKTERRRRAAYFWIGCLAILTLAAIAFVIWQVLRRQMRLARLKTDLIAAVSHELKTPLASMRLLVETLLDDDGPAPDARKTREYLQLIAGENLRLSRLIENFLSFSRIERHRHRFDFAPVSAAEIVETAVDSVRERMLPNGCMLDVEVSPGLPLMRADGDALVTVLLNLLDNAYKYTPGSGKRIAVRARAADGGVVFEISDNGIGIAAREQKRIFERFYQVDRRLSRETGGCGLGLSIVDFIVRAHGGSIAVDSAPSQGSTFRVTIPATGLAERATA